MTPLLALVLLLALPHRPVPPPVAAPLAAGPDDARRDAVRSLRDELFPPPLPQATLDWWAVAGGLDPDAISLLRQVHEEYLAALGAAGGAEDTGAARRGPDPETWLAAAYDWNAARGRLEPRLVPALVSMHRARLEWISSLHRGEERLARAYLAMVPPERAAQARRLAHRREVELLSLSPHRVLATVDLAAIVDEAGLDEEELAAVTPALEDAMRKLSAALRWRVDTILAAEIERAELLVDLGPAWELVSAPAERRATDAALADLRARAARADAPLQDLVLEGVRRILAPLPPTSQIAVQDRLFRQLGGERFEDERQLGEIFDAAVASAASTEPAAGGNPAAADGDEADTPAVAPQERGERERAARIDLFVATRLRLLPLGLESIELADEAAALVLDSPAEAIPRIELELRGLAVNARRHEVCLDAANGLATLLRADEAGLLGRIERYREEVGFVAASDAWLAERWRERLGEVRRLGSQPPPGEAAEPEPVGDDVR